MEEWWFGGYFTADVLMRYDPTHDFTPFGRLFPPGATTAPFTYFPYVSPRRSQQPTGQQPLPGPQPERRIMGVAMDVGYERDSSVPSAGDVTGTGSAGFVSTLDQNIGQMNQARIQSDPEPQRPPYPFHSPIGQAHNNLLVGPFLQSMAFVQPSAGVEPPVAPPPPYGAALDSPLTHNQGGFGRDETTSSRQSGMGPGDGLSLPIGDGGADGDKETRRVAGDEGPSGWNRRKEGRIELLTPQNAVTPASKARAEQMTTTLKSMLGVGKEGGGRPVGTQGMLHQPHPPPYPPPPRPQWGGDASVGRPTPWNKPSPPDAPMKRTYQQQQQGYALPKTGDPIGVDTSEKSSNLTPPTIDGSTFPSLMEVPNGSNTLKGAGATGCRVPTAPINDGSEEGSANNQEHPRKVNAWGLPVTRSPISATDMTDKAPTPKDTKPPHTSQPSLASPSPPPFSALRGKVGGVPPTAAKAGIAPSGGEIVGRKHKAAPPPLLSPRLRQESWSPSCDDTDSLKSKQGTSSQLSGAPTQGKANENEFPSLDLVVGRSSDSLDKRRQGKDDSPNDAWSGAKGGNILKPTPNSSTPPANEPRLGSESSIKQAAELASLVGLESLDKVCIKDLMGLGSAQEIIKKLEKEPQYRGTDLTRFASVLLAISQSGRDPQGRKHDLASSEMLLIESSPHRLGAGKGGGTSRSCAGTTGRFTATSLTPPAAPTEQTTPPTENLVPPAKPVTPAKRKKPGKGRQVNAAEILGFNTKSSRIMQGTIEYG
eukprot:GHVN01034200.1.p2 GENE.GHVN01034200.1~~GHVN01034200.1.p2  ORF type:complete len:764 (+),score=120.13 GHVN01034200.1:2629-4920(+)